MINKEVVRNISDATKHYDVGKNIFYTYVSNSEIDKTKTYITYYQETSTPHYDTMTASTVFNISVFTQTLAQASEIKRAIGFHFSSIENDNIILETSIEDERELLDEDSGLYQAMISIRVLHRI